jgi:uncharacterized repeat protein (TIGR03803 family)
MKNSLLRLRSGAAGLVLAATLALAAGAKAETYRVLHSFLGGSDGARPAGNLYIDLNAGLIYGTTFSGGHVDLGTVFQVNPFGDLYKVVHSFSGTAGGDGANPRYGVIGHGGLLFGTTQEGGIKHSVFKNVGTVFKMDRAGKTTILHSFLSGVEYFPQSPLTADAAGNLYGTTYGEIFRVTQGGEKTRAGYFSGTSGTRSSGGVVLDPAGNIYGTCADGGAHNLGTVYKVPAGGGYAVAIHNFTAAQGSNPISGLLRDPAGTLFGTAIYPGSVFKITPAGSF